MYLCSNSQPTFLSTPSARRATKNREPERDRLEISIHALREEGDLCSVLLQTRSGYFYPRPPRGGRPCLGRAFCVKFRFLSTPSARRATHPIKRHCQPGSISIHALREEGDCLPCITKPDLTHFYPRPPRGGRLSALRF